MHVTFSHYVVGLAMGIADLVPGVSGGTVAFVSGRYERLVDAIHGVDGRAVRMLVTLQLRALWKRLDLGLLLPLLLGIGTSVLVLSGLLDGWLNDADARPMLFSFFIGLVIASAVLVGRRLSWSVRVAALAAVGAVIGFGVAAASPARTPETAGWAMLAGALAICAMILPGISGSFILLLAGQYERAVEAVHTRDVPTVALYGVGALLGLVVFVRLLRWVLARHHDPTIAVLVGFIIGSLPRLWPWTDCVDCAEFVPVAPSGSLVVAVLLGLVGAGAMVLFERWATAESG